MRRAEIGIHHKIAGPYLAAYAGEMDWREDTAASATASNTRSSPRRAGAPGFGPVEGPLAEEREE